MAKTPKGLELQPVDKSIKPVKVKVCKNCEAQTTDLSKKGLCPICTEVGS